MTIDTVAKRFQFDLEMGLFTEAYDFLDYVFYSDRDVNSALVFIDVLKELGYKPTRENDTFNSDESFHFITITSCKRKLYCFYSSNSMDPIFDNPIPDYIKEFIKNGD